MNQRILELMRQSGAYDYYEINEGVDGDEHPMIKFAQLIIEEANNVVYSLLEENTGAEVVVRVKEHFGVEE